MEILVGKKYQSISASETVIVLYVDKRTILYEVLSSVYPNIGERRIAKPSSFELCYRTTKKIVEAWINIYPTTRENFQSEDVCVILLFNSKESADNADNLDRIDCIKITWEVEE